MRVLVRADGGATVGLGHVMRCLALSQSLGARGIGVTLATHAPSEAIRARHASEGIDVVAIDAPPGSDADAIETAARARAMGAAVVADGYRFGPAFERVVRDAGRTTVLALDDHAEIGPAHECDLLLDQNLGASADRYPTRAAWTEVLAGASYALLRREFVDVPARRATMLPKRPRLLLTFGGADTAGATAAVLEALLDRPLSLVVVVGAASPHRPAIEAIVARGGRADVELLSHVSDMTTVLGRVDAAFSASGSTVWELARMGVPAVVHVAAPNQARVASAAERHGLARVLPDLTHAAIDEAFDALTDGPWYASAVAAGPTIIDGRGAARVAERLIERVRTGSR